MNARHLPLIEPRPETRADCIDGPRPCTNVACRWHLLLDQAEEGTHTPRLVRLRRLRGAAADALVEELAEALATMVWSCALDVADQGARTLDDVAEALGGISRERVRQIETKALAKVKRANLLLGTRLEQALDEDGADHQGGGWNAGGDW